MTKALLCLPSVSYSVVKDRSTSARPAEPEPAVCVAEPPQLRGAHAAPRSIKVATACAAADPLSDLVEIAGLEPAASGLQSRRSPS